MKQFFEHYEKWEDYQNGMYCGTFENNAELIEKAKSLLSNPSLFYETALKLITSWPIATKINLTNLGCNRRAWLGQAACSYLHNVPEILTRQAWVELNELQRFEANSVAEKIIVLYERKDLELHQEVGDQLLLKWDS